MFLAAFPIKFARRKLSTVKKRSKENSHGKFDYSPVINWMKELIDLKLSKPQDGVSCGPEG